MNITSVSAVLGNRGQANYAAAKAGIHGATRSLARELASRGVTVNAVAPGIIAGEMADAVFDNAQIDNSPRLMALAIRFCSSCAS